ncbi:MAG: hypothetical protein AAFU74_13885, partial [Bacteroidota bacterium]
MNILGKKVMSRILILLFSMVFVLPLVAQRPNEKRLDSLEQLLALTSEGREKVDVLCALTKGYDGIDSSKTFQYGRHALQLSRKINYDLGIAHANFLIGRAHMYTKPSLSLEFLQKGDSLASLLLAEVPSAELKKIWTSGK